MKILKQHQKTADLIIDSIRWDSLEDSYPNARDMDFSELCQVFIKIAIQRKSYKDDKRPLQAIISEFIEGLPTEIVVPFENHHILEWQKAQGIIKENSSEPQKEMAIENYWRFIPLIIKKYGA